MCNLNDNDKSLVVQSVQALVKKGQPFTGRDVAEHVHVNWHRIEPREVSSYVRELFNGGEDFFNGWASTQVIPRKGPLLFFKVTRNTSAAKKARKIRDSIENTGA